MDVKFFTDKGMKLSHGDFAWIPLSNSMVEIELLPPDFIVDINYEESDENCPWTVSDALRVLSNPWRHTKSWRPSMSNFQDEVKPIPQTEEVCTEDVTGVPEWDGEYQLEDGKNWFKYKTTYTSSTGDIFAMCLVPNANKGKPFEQYLDFATTKFKPLETEAEKMERERLENGKAYYQLMSDIETSVMNPEDNGYPNEWDELREDWQEVYMRQAETLGFKKGE